MSVKEFENVGKEKGLLIWRIESFNPVPVPLETYGKFYIGDSYIVLSTKEDEQKHTLSWDIHFWLGDETTQDESGTAAYLTVKLDDQLRGAAKQHREVQEHESEMFLSYFKDGIRYEQGGVDSGFNNVTVNAIGQKRLFHVKGHRLVRVRQVEVSVKSMNRGDCFILDTGRILYIYVGPKSSRSEKHKARNAAAQIRDQDHRGRGLLEFIDEFSSRSDQKKFFKELGSGSPEEVAEGADDDQAADAQDPPTLYVVHDVDGALTLKTVGIAPLHQELMKSQECYVLDAKTQVFVWIGKEAPLTGEKRTKAMAVAQEFMANQNYPKWTQLDRLIQFGESAAFKSFFANWYDKDSTLKPRSIKTKSSRTAVPVPLATASFEEDEHIHSRLLQEVYHSGGYALRFMPDGADGTMEQYRIEDQALVRVIPEQVGVLYSNDVYVILYRFRDKRRSTPAMVYLWQGKQSTADERSTGAVLALAKRREIDKYALLVRVCQNHEPRHFLKIWNGSLIMLLYSSWRNFHDLRDPKTYDTNGCRMFRVRGATGPDVRTEQRPPYSYALASDDAFVLETPTRNWLWHGRGASEVEKLTAREVAARVAPHHGCSSSAFLNDPEALTQVVQEGSEPAEFWEALTDRLPYDTTLGPVEKVPLKETAVIAYPRLVRCSWSANLMRADELKRFEQKDLDPASVMVLDGGDEVYAWVGNRAPEDADRRALSMAVKYIRTEASERTEDTAIIIRVQQATEPRSFRRLFPAWDDAYWTVDPGPIESLTRSKVYRQIKRAAGSAVSCRGVQSTR